MGKRAAGRGVCGVAGMWKVWGVSDVQRYRIEPGEWLRVPGGVVMVVDAVAVLQVDGALSLDGVVKVGADV